MARARWRRLARKNYIQKSQFLTLDNVKLVMSHLYGTNYQHDDRGSSCSIGSCLLAAAGGRNMFIPILSANEHN